MQLQTKENSNEKAKKIPGPFDNMPTFLHKVPNSRGSEIMFEIVLVRFEVLCYTIG